MRTGNHRVLHLGVITYLGKVKNTVFQTRREYLPEARQKDPF